MSRKGLYVFTTHATIIFSTIFDVQLVESMNEEPMDRANCIKSQEQENNSHYYIFDSTLYGSTIQFPIRKHEEKKKTVFFFSCNRLVFIEKV